MVQAVHDCNPRPTTPEEMRRVGELCNGRERCQFVPGPEFFQRFADCWPDHAKTWMTWRCNGNEDRMIVNNNF